MTIARAAADVAETVPQPPEVAQTWAVTLNLAPDRLLRTGGDRLARVRARVTPREARLAAILGLIVLVAATVWAFDWAGTQRARYAAAQDDLILARQNRLALERSGLNAFDQAQLRALSAWSEHGRSIWLVRVRVEQRLMAAATAAGLTDPEVQIAEAPEGDTATPVLRAEIAGPYRSAAVLGLLQRLSQDPQTFLVDRLEVSGEGAPAYKLSLLFPVAIDGTPGP